MKNVKKKPWLLERNEHKTEQTWVKFLQQKDLLVWRRPLNENGLYQYKGDLIMSSDCLNYLVSINWILGYKFSCSGLCQSSFAIQPFQKPILYLKFKLSNQNIVLLPRDEVISH